MTTRRGVFTPPRQARAGVVPALRCEDVGVGASEACRLALLASSTCGVRIEAADFAGEAPLRGVGAKFGEAEIAGEAGTGEPAGRTVRRGMGVAGSEPDIFPTNA